MRILVQKFGGTSVADIDRLKMVRGKVKAALDQGYKVVVVLSAKSGKTNKLLDLSTRWAAEPDLAEVDSLLSTGEQASIALFSHVAQGLRHRGAFDARLADPDHHE